MKEWICKEVVALTMDGKVCGTMLNEEQELVRCKDCKYGAKENNAKGEQMIECGIMYNDAWLKDPDWFCADGEMKQNNG